MANELLTPAGIQRPGHGQDPGVSMRPSTVLLSPVRDPMGDALNEFSRDLSGIAATFKELYKTRQDAEDRSFVDKYQLEYNKRVTPIETDALNGPDSSKPDFVNKLDQRLAETQNSLMEELLSSGQFNPSKNGKEAAIRAAMQLRIAAARRSAVTAHNQRVTRVVDEATANVGEVARASGASGELDAGIDRVDSTIKSLERVLPPDKLRELQKTAREQVVESVVRSHIERGNFAAARMLLDRNRGYAANTTEGAIAQAAAKHGVDPAYLVAAARAESSLDPGAKPRVDPATGKRPSNAAGIFQMVPETAKQFGLPEDASTAPVEQQIEAGARFAALNKKVLQQALKRDPTPGEMYLAHFLGAGDAVKVLTAPKDLSGRGVSLDGLVGSKSIAANKAILDGKTTDDVIEWANRKMLAAGAGGSANFIKEDTRIALLSQLETRQHQMDVRAREEANRQTKLIGEAFLKEAFTQANNGRLSPDYVEQIKPWISPTEYKGLLSTLGKEDNIDDQAAIVDLTTRIDTEDPNEFMTRATDWMNKGKLKTGTYTAMVQRNRTAFRDDRPASPFKSGRELVSTSLDPGALSTAGPEATQHMRVARANALIEFDQWIEANPQAKREDIINEAQNIVRRYEPVAQERMKMAIGLSRYFGDKSRNAITMKEVEDAELALHRDIESGRLTPAQQGFEIRKLKNWREIIARETALKAQQPGQRK